MHAILSALFIVSMTAGPALAQTADPPPAVTPGGAAALPLAGQAERARLLGTQALYSLALYSEGGRSDRGRLVAADAPKALRIAITYQDDLRRPTTREWMRELVPDLEPAEAAHLSRAFAPLRHGDVVLIEYSPAKGTTVWVNRSIAVSGGHHELMLAFLDHWIGQRPVSSEIKRALTAGHSDVQR